MSGFPKGTDHTGPWSPHLVTVRSSGKPPLDDMKVTGPVCPPRLLVLWNLKLSKPGKGSSLIKTIQNYDCPMFAASPIYRRNHKSKNAYGPWGWNSWVIMWHLTSSRRDRVKQGGCQRGKLVTNQVTLNVLLLLISWQHTISKGPIHFSRLLFL